MLTFREIMTGEDRFYFVEEKNGHFWHFWKDDKFQVCKNCLAIRRKDDKNSECRGKAKVRL